MSGLAIGALIGTAVVAIYLLAWSLVRVAAQADRRLEEMREKAQAREPI